VKAAVAIAEILKREGVELLVAYPRNAVIEPAAAAEARDQAWDRAKAQRNARVARIYH
jgi:hypothetical protein